MFNKYQVNIHHQIISNLSKTVNNNLLYITLILNLNHNKMKVKVYHKQMKMMRNNKMIFNR